MTTPETSIDILVKVHEAYTVSLIKHRFKWTNRSKKVFENHSFTTKEVTRFMELLFRRFFTSEAVENVRPILVAYRDAQDDDLQFIVCKEAGFEIKAGRGKTRATMVHRYLASLIRVKKSTDLGTILAKGQAIYLMARTFGLGFLLFLRGVISR
jgi:hypothetical protein